MSKETGDSSMEHDNNRNAALSPEQLALVNSSTSAVIKEMMATMIRDIVAPLLKETALTPEKLAILKSTYVDSKLAARELRESAQTREQEAENIRLREQMRANCLHTDKNGKSAICLIHNYPDRQPRGICPLCQDIINPREWVIGAPDPKTGKTTPFLRPAHKNYDIVRQIESMA
jgi:hypothetical protein